MSNDIVEVPFNGSVMIAQKLDDGEIYAALKPICENIGIAFNGQRERLNRTPWAVVRMIRTTGADGKRYDMMAVSRKTLTMWLATIDTSRLKDEHARRNVTVYQQEAAEALDKYFNEGGAIRVSDADSDEDIMARAVLVAQKTIERKNQQLQAKDNQIKELETKAKALDDFTNVPDVLLVRDAAKLLSNNSNIQIGEHELRQWLVDNGWIYRQSNQSWCAASSRVRQGHMVMVSSRSHGIHKDGTPFAYPPTPKLTRKGLALIHQRLSEQSFERVLDAEVAA
jgi:phage antirepressor YoqD-like protein